MTTTYQSIADLLHEELYSEEGDGREEVLKPLCQAFVAAYAFEEEGSDDDEVLDDEQAAHKFYLDCYYKHGKDRRTGTATYMESNPHEVSVPDWCPLNQRRLLRMLARWERDGHEAFNRACRREMGHAS